METGLLLLGSEQLRETVDRYHQAVAAGKPRQAQGLLFDSMQLLMQETMHGLLLDRLGEVGMSSAYSKQATAAFDKLIGLSTAGLKRALKQFSLENHRALAANLAERRVYLDDEPEPDRFIFIPLDDAFAQTLLESLQAANDGNREALDTAIPAAMCTIVDVIFELYFLHPLELVDAGYVMRKLAAGANAAAGEAIKQSIRSGYGALDHDQRMRVCSSIEQLLVELR